MVFVDLEEEYFINNIKISNCMLDFFSDFGFFEIKKSKKKKCYTRFPMKNFFFFRIISEFQNQYLKKDIT